MRAAISIVLMLSLACQCAVQLGVLAWYELNKDFIAKNLCENRDRPAMHCNGKCQLNKQLKKADPQQEHNTKQLPGKNHKIEWSDLMVSRQITISCFAPAGGHRDTPAGQHMFGHTPVRSVFHPPAVC